MICWFGVIHSDNVTVIAMLSESLQNPSIQTLVSKWSFSAESVSQQVANRGCLLCNVQYNERMDNKRIEIIFCSEINSITKLPGICCIDSSCLDDAITMILRLKLRRKYQKSSLLQRERTT